MLLALSSGHSGLSTVHAESATAAINRISSLATTAGPNISRAVTTDLIKDAINLVIYLKRVGNTRLRKVAEIVEIVGVEGEQVKSNPIFVLNDREELVFSGTLPRCYSKLQEAGLKSWLEICEIGAEFSFDPERLEKQPVKTLRAER